jgi:hypothetical protein
MSLFPGTARSRQPRSRDQQRLSPALLAPSAPALPGTCAISLATAAILLCLTRAAAGVSLPDLGLFIPQPGPVIANQTVFVNPSVSNSGVATQSTTLTLLLPEGLTVDSRVIPGP